MDRILTINVPVFKDVKILRTLRPVGTTKLQRLFIWIANKLRIRFVDEDHKSIFDGLNNRKINVKELHESIYELLDIVHNKYKVRCDIDYLLCPSDIYYRLLNYENNSLCTEGLKIFGMTIVHIPWLTEPVPLPKKVGILKIDLE